MIPLRFTGLTSIKNVLSNENSSIFTTISKCVGHAWNRRFETSSSEIITKDRSKLFFTEEAQKLMKWLTGFPLNKEYKTKPIEEKLYPPMHQFMTNEELKTAQARAIKRAYEKLQMPPLIPVNKGEIEILDETPEMIGFTKSKYLFTDISYGVSDRKRVIVVREPNGVLRKALPFERHRMNQLYFPRVGREYQHPRMFQRENLQPLWEKKEFEFILDRACCQFEPDDPQFHEVIFTTFDKVNEVKAFNVLRSTRHFGPLVFYLCIKKNLDNLIEENLDSERLLDAVNAIQLYCVVNKDTKFSKFNADSQNNIEYIRAFLETESSKADLLIPLLESYCTEKKPADISNG